MNAVSFKTLSIKARVYNKIRTKLYQKTLEKMSNTEKVAFFDELYALNHEAHWELIHYKRKRQEKRKIQIKRALKEEDNRLNGIAPKVKTTKVQYEAMKVKV